MNKKCPKGEHKFFNTEEKPPAGYNQRLRKLICSRCGAVEWKLLTQAKSAREEGGG